VEGSVTENARFGLASRFWLAFRSVLAAEIERNLDYAATLTLLEKWAGVQVKGKAA
jgi:hypothetical protein